MNTLNLINQLPKTKSESRVFANQVKAEIISGNVNALDFRIHLKAIENFIEAVAKDKEVKKLVLSEAEKYDEKSFEHLGANITISEAGVKYTYSDAKLDALMTRKAKLDADIKSRQTYLKGLTEREIDLKTGEVKAELPIKTSTTIVKITL